MNRKKQISPGRILVETFLKPSDISCEKLAADIRVPVSRIEAVAKGEEGITADLALRLGRYFGNGPEFWLKLALDAAAQSLGKELDAIPQLANAPSAASTKREPKARSRTPEEKKRLKDWLEECKNSDDLEFQWEIEEALSVLRGADLSHPSDELARAAVMVGNIDAIRKLAGAGYKRWCVKKIGWNAFRTPCVDVVGFIVEQGFDIEDTEEEQEKGPATPLCLAAQSGHADVVQYLLSAGADAKFVNTRGFTPLHFAASSRSFETVKLLVEAGADVNAAIKARRNWWPATSVMEMMAENQFYEGLKYLAEHGASLRHPKQERSLLETACVSRIRTGARETADYLLDVGSDPNAAAANYSSAVEYASRFNNIGALRSLAAHGVSLDKSPITTKNDKLLPLEIAARSDSDEDLLLETLEFISEHSRPFAETHVLNCALYSDLNPRARVCKYLLEKGCPVNTAWKRIDFGGRTYFSPLHAITSSRNEQRAEIVSMLLAAGAEVDQKDPAGYTPLANVVEYPGGRKDLAEVITLLHEAGADFNAKSNAGLSILQICQRTCGGDSSILELLKKLGAK